MKRITIIMVATILMVVGTIGCIDMNTPEKWTWEFEADTWHEVTFTQEMFTVAGSDTPEIVFSGAINLNYEVWVFQEQPGDGLVSWYSKRSINELTNILPDIVCNVNIKGDYVLIIER